MAIVEVLLVSIEKIHVYHTIKTMLAFLYGLPLERARVNQIPRCERVSEMALSCALGAIRVSRKENFPENRVINLRVYGSRLHLVT